MANNFRQGYYLPFLLERTSGRCYIGMPIYEKLRPGVLLCGELLLQDAPVLPDPIMTLYCPLPGCRLLEIGNVYMENVDEDFADEIEQSYFQVEQTLCKGNVKIDTVEIIEQDLLPNYAKVTFRYNWRDKSRTFSCRLDNIDIQRFCYNVKNMYETVITTRRPLINAIRD